MKVQREQGWQCMPGVSRKATQPLAAPGSPAALMWCPPVAKPPPCDVDLPPRKSQRGCNSSWLTRHQRTSPHCLPSHVLYSVILHHHIHMFWAGSEALRASPGTLPGMPSRRCSFQNLGLAAPLGIVLPPGLPCSLWSLMFSTSSG